MRMVDIIEKKRDGNALTQEEIHFFIDGYCKGIIPDYQVSALLMAIYFRGMNDDEISILTMEMLHSGDVIDLSPIKGVKCDKHSTGGVGDKTSLVVLPIAAACGIKMAKMSGRGLGHTGGTVDKIESIPGATVELSTDEFFKQVNEIGIAIAGQSAKITPADKLLYALRDVTATIESIPLISSSIMSKKLASGSDNILIDVKVGDGAFMKDVDRATELSKEMVKIGKAAGRTTVATLTDMNEPLGDAVGNSLEVIEAIETLKGHGPKDFTELCKVFSREALLVTGLAKTEEEASLRVEEAISSGKALEVLRQMIIYQHGNGNVIDDYSLFKQAKEVIEVHYEGSDAYVKDIKALDIGLSAMLLGAGRSTKEEAIDPAVGIVLNKKVGDFVQNNELLFTIYSNGKNTSLAKDKALNAYKFSSNYVEPLKKIIKVIR